MESQIFFNSLSLYFSKKESKVGTMLSLVVKTHMFKTKTPTLKNESRDVSRPRLKCREPQLFAVYSTCCIVMLLHGYQLDVLKIQDAWEFCTRKFQDYSGPKWFSRTWKNPGRNFQVLSRMRGNLLVNRKVIFFTKQTNLNWFIKMNRRINSKSQMWIRYTVLTRDLRIVFFVRIKSRIDTAVRFVFESNIRIESTVYQTSRNTA